MSAVSNVPTMNQAAVKAASAAVLAAGVHTAPQETAARGQSPARPEVEAAAQDPAPVPGGAAAAFQLAAIQDDGDAEPSAVEIVAATLPTDTVIEPTLAEELEAIEPAAGENGGSATPGNTGHGTEGVGAEDLLDALSGASEGDSASLDGSGALAGTTLEIGDPFDSGDGSGDVALDPPALVFAEPAGPEKTEFILGTGGSETIDVRDIDLSTVIEVDAGAGNDVILASNITEGAYRGGSGNDTLTAGAMEAIWLYSGASNGFDTLNNGAGTSIALAQGAGTVIGLNGFNNGVDQVQGAGDTILRDSTSSRTLNFSNTLLTGVSEIDASGGNDTVTASSLSDGVYRGGAGDDVLNAGTTSVTWLYSGASNGFDTLNNGAGTSIALAQGAGTVIGLNGFANGVDQVQGAGDTILRDSTSSRTLNFSNTLLTGVSEIDAAAGNDTVTASNLSDGVYRGGAGDDTLNAGTTSVTWLYSGASNGFDTLNNGAGTSIALAQGAGTVIGLNGFANGVDQVQGAGDTILRDSNASRRSDLSDTSLSGIVEVDAAGGNDVVATALSNGAAITYDGGAGTDTLRLSLSNAQAADTATLAEIAAYRAHLAGANHADPFTFGSLGITVESFESLKINNVIEIGGDIGPASGTADSIDISLNDVLDLTTEASNPLLTILGDANDQVTLNGGWTQQANADGFQVFTQSVVGVGVVTLRVDDDVQSVAVVP